MLRVPSRMKLNPKPAPQTYHDIDAPTADLFLNIRPGSCIFGGNPLSLTCNPQRIFKRNHAPVPLFPADPARYAERRRDRLAPADAARWHDAPGSGGHLRLPAARLPRAAKNLRDRARGAEPLRCHRAFDADHAVGGFVERERTLRGL